MGGVTGIQLIAIAFAAIMAYFSYTSWRRKELETREAFLWLAVWIALILISLFPERLRAVISPLQVARLLDLVIVGAILFLAVLTFALNRTVRRIEQRMTRLVQSLALREGQESSRD